MLAASDHDAFSLNLSYASLHKLTSAQDLGFECIPSSVGFIVEMLHSVAGKRHPAESMAQTILFD